jgi:hypothetical protein
MPVLFHTGRALGIRPSELSPLGRYPLVSGRKHPHAVSPAVAPWLESLQAGAGPTGCSSWASTLSRVPGDRHRISAPATGCSLGLFPSRAYGQKPCPGLSPGAPPTRLPHQSLTALPRRRLGVFQPPLGSFRSPDKPAGGRGNPYRVLAPDAPRHLSACVVRAMSSPHAFVGHHCRRTSDLWTTYSLDRSCSGSHLRCRASWAPAPFST